MKQKFIPWRWHNSFVCLCLNSISLSLDTQVAFPPEEDTNSVFSSRPRCEVDFSCLCSFHSIVSVDFLYISRIFFVGLHLPNSQYSRLPSSDEAVTRAWPIRPPLPSLGYSDWFIASDVTQREWIRGRCYLLMGFPREWDGSLELVIANLLPAEKGLPKNRTTREEKEAITVFGFPHGIVPQVHTWTLGYMNQ